MPLFEFGCQQCPERVEIFFSSVKEDQNLRCQKCGADMTRILTAPSTYRIRGNNSASTTPKKHRGGRAHN